MRRHRLRQQTRPPVPRHSTRSARAQSWTSITQFLGGTLALAAVVVAGAPRGARALDVTGAYKGTATLEGVVAVALSVTLNQNGTTVTGTLNVRGFDCLSSLSFSGTLSGTTLSGSFTGASTIAISGTASGNELSGTFDISDAPCATVGSGPFMLTKVVPTATLTRTPAAATATPTPKPAAGAPCVGDCNGSDEVTVDELITGVNIALGNTPLSACAVFNPNGDAEVTVNELITAVNNALIGCTPSQIASEVDSNMQTVGNADDFMRHTGADDPVDARMGDTLAFVKAQPGVADASLFPNGLTILITHTNGLQSALMLMPDFVEDTTAATAAVALTDPWSTGGAAADPTDVPTTAVLVQGRDLPDKLRNDHYPMLESTLHSMGFGLGNPGQGVEVLAEGSFTTDFFRTKLGKYQIVYIIGHGGNDGSTSALATGRLGPPGASFPSPAGSDATDIDNKRLLTAITSPGILTRIARWTGYDTKPTPRYLVTPAFITNYYPGDPARLARDSLVYFDGCNLLADTPRALAAAGAAAVVYFAGNTVDTETTLLGTPPIDRAFFKALAQGQSVDEAIDAAKANASQVTLTVYPPEGGQLRFIPLMSVDFSPSCENPPLNQEVTFTQDMVAPANAQIAKWVWDFGDRSAPEESTFLPARSRNDIKHTYKEATEDDAKPGYSTPFTVTLTVTDLFGHQVKKEKSLRLLMRAPRQVGGLGAGSCPVPPPPTDQIRIKVIMTYSDDPNAPIADRLYNVHVLIGSTDVVIGSDDNIARTTVDAGSYVIKFPKDNGLDDEHGTHLYRVGSVNLHVTKEGGSGIRCAPNTQEGDVRAAFDPSASNPSALSEYEVALRIVPYDAPVLQNGAACN